MSGPSQPSAPFAGEVTLLLQDIAQDHATAAERILPVVYHELRRLAAAKLAHEPAGQTLQPTALVHEAWLKLGGDQQTNWKNRAHFFAAAAEAMRRILVDQARRRRTVRHGHGLQRLNVDATGFNVASPDADDGQLLLLDEALELLAACDPRRAELVKLRFFVGLTQAEAAEVMGCSEGTAKRDWVFARAWLFNEIKRLQR